MKRKASLLLSAIVLVSVLLMVTAIVKVTAHEPQAGGNSFAGIIRMSDRITEASLWSSLWPRSLEMGTGILRSHRHEFPPGYGIHMYDTINQ